MRIRPRAKPVEIASVNRTEIGKQLADILGASAQPRSQNYITAAFTFSAGVVSLQLMKGLAIRRTIKHTNPPAPVPHITGTDT